MTEALHKEAVVNMVATAFSGGTPASPAAEVPQDSEITAFTFDEDFQTRIVYLSVFDQSFMRRTSHLLRPEYFEKAGEAALMSVVLTHWRDYQSVLGDQAVIAMAVKDAVSKKLLRKEIAPELIAVMKEIQLQQISIRKGEAIPLNAQFVADKIAEFVRLQAVIAAVTKSVSLIDRGEFDKIEKLVSDAIRIALDQDENGGEYYERLAVRTGERADESVGKKAPRGITTGHPKLDALLYHRGFGRKELTVLLGGAKAGKTMALIEFASAASYAGYNVLYATLEVSNRIVEERADARFSEIRINDLVSNFGEVNDRIEKLAIREGRGRFYIAEFPSGSMSPSMLRSMLERHQAKGWSYDMVVVDYADIMAPDYRTNDVIENSKQIYIGLRAIAQEWNCAMLTATQSNREGFKSVTAKAEHTADDFNKVRTADLFISINSTEEERRDGKARLFFAASRNQASGMTVFITQDMSCGRFMKMVERVE